MMKTRREFIRNTAAIGALAAAPQARSASLPRTEIQKSFDIVVIGAGTAGTIAAIQAGRLGLRTLLVEKNGMPGGTTTVAAVNFPGLFHAWGRQIIAGIGWELVSGAVALTGARLPDFTQIPERHWQQQVRVNRALYAALACEAIEGAGVEALFHAMPASAEENDSGVQVTLCTKTGLQTITARALIDASGDATAAAMAGYPLVAHETRQPGTLMLTLSGYNAAALNASALQNAFREALDRGELTPQDGVFVRNNIVGFLRAQGDNCTHIPGIDGRASAGRSAAEINSRISLLRVFRFLRRQPGLENFEVTFMAPECGVRETVTIQGEATVTHADYVSGRLWDDAVCYSFYPIDLHHAAGGGIDTRPLQPGAFPTVPRGALIPRGSRRLLVAGRCLSSDREANSALRVQATCMACGQAAAAVAAHAIWEDTTVMGAAMDGILGTLREHNAIIPEEGGPALST